MYSIDMQRYIFIVSGGANFFGESSCSLLMLRASIKMGF